MLLYQHVKYIKSAKRFLFFPVVLACLLLILVAPAKALDSDYNSNDAYGSCTYGQTCTEPSTGNDTTSDSGSAGDIDTSTDSSQVVLNDFPEYVVGGEGKTLDVSLNQEIQFYIIDRDPANLHTIKLTEIGSDYVVFTIDSTQTIRLSINQSGQYDVNNDGQADIEIMLNSVTDTTANMTFKPLSTAPTASTAPPKTTAKTADSKTKKNNHLGLILSILAVVIALGIYLWLFFVRRRRKNKTQTW